MATAAGRASVRAKRTLSEKIDIALRNGLRRRARGSCGESGGGLAARSEEIFGSRFDGEPTSMATAHRSGAHQGVT